MGKSNNSGAVSEVTQRYVLRRRRCSLRRGNRGKPGASGRPACPCARSLDGFHASRFRGSDLRRRYHCVRRGSCAAASSARGSAVFAREAAAARQLAATALIAHAAARVQRQRAGSRCSASSLARLSDDQHVVKVSLALEDSLLAPRSPPLVCTSVHSRPGEMFKLK